MRKITKRSAAIIGATALAIGAAGAAWAAWNVSGHGTSQATAGGVVELHVTAVAADTLFPGSTSNLTVGVDNPNKFPVQVNTIAISSITSTPSLCAAEIGQNTAASLSTVPADLLVPANGGKDIVFTNALKMTGSNDACHDATYSFTVTVSGGSAAA